MPASPDASEIQRWATELSTKLGDRLVSVTLFGSHSTGQPHPRDKVRLCVELDPCDRDTLELVGQVLAGPMRRGRVAPYVIGRGELMRLSDTFPLRVHEMRARHRVLSGVDPLAEVAVSREALRVGVERGLRNHLVRVRTMLVAHGSDGLARQEALSGIAESIGEEAHGLEALGEPPASDVLARLEALRDGAPADERLLADTLNWLEASVARVDQMEAL